jgi:acyl carrier protein
MPRQNGEEKVIDRDRLSARSSCEPNTVLLQHQQENRTMRQPVENIVRAMLAEHLEADIAAIHLDHDLAADLGLTPLAVVLVVLDLEDLEGVFLPFDQLVQVKTVADLARFLSHARSEKQGLRRYAAV